VAAGEKPGHHLVILLICNKEIKQMTKKLFIALSAALLAQTPAYAIDAKYRQKLERSGCTQATELQGCDINKSKAENAKAGFVTEAPAKNGKSASPTPSAALYKDLQGTSAISGFDRMTERGFKSVDYIESGDTQYSIYYNSNTRQCIQLTVANSKILSADDIHTHPKCR
jgi:hypothetical protein